MRNGEHCINCGHVETVNWLPSTWDVEKDVVQLDAFPPPFPNDQWEYRVSKNGQYVIRLLKSVYSARGKWSIDKRKQWDSNKKALR